MVGPGRSPDHDHDGNHPLRLAFVMEQVLGHVTVYRNLRSGIERLDDANADVRWIETAMFDERGVLERVPGVPAFLRASARALIDCRRGLRGWSPDVLVFNTQKAAALCQWQLLRTPTILMTDVTPLQLDRMAEHYDHVVAPPGPVATLKHQANVLNFRLARAVVPTSAWARDSLIHDYGVPPHKIQINPVGVDTAYFQPADGHRRTERVQLLFVGGHFERKGGKLLLDVFRQLELAAWADLHIVTRDAVQSEPGVVVHGAIPYESPAFLRAYQQADLFVLPTLADCYTNVSLEATAVGLPIVATRMGGLPDIVEDGRNGYLVPPGDGRALGEALLRVIHDPSRRAAFASEARARALDRFDARKNAARLLDLARSLVANRWVARPAQARRGRCPTPGDPGLTSPPILNPVSSSPRSARDIVQVAAAGASATAHLHPRGATDGAAS